MATRVRKLAKETGQPGEHLLGVLRALGYRQYRSVEDMLSQDVVAKLRRALRAGVAPEGGGAPAAAEVSQRSEIERLAQGDLDVMGRLMPQVRPLEDRGGAPGGSGHPDLGGRGADAARARPSAPVESNSPVYASAMSDREAAIQSRERTLEHARRRLEEERRHLETERERVEALRVAVEQEREALDERRDSLDALQEALQEERRILSADREAVRASSTASLVSLLEARGLRGIDEFERAIVGLARARRLQEVLLTLGTDQPRQVRRLLDDHVLLTGPHPPEALQARSDALVCVGSERAEVPDASDLARLGERLSDALLLSGLQALRVVGGRPILFRLLQDALDPRVSITWALGTPRSVPAAREDVSEADLVVLWGVEEAPEARALYDAARPEVLRSRAPDLSRLVHEIATR